MQIRLDEKYRPGTRQSNLRPRTNPGRRRGRWLALKELGVLSGLRVERAELGKAGEFQWIESLTPEDLRARADGTLDIGAYRSGDDADRPCVN